MYNLELNSKEEIIKIFDEFLIKQGNNQKIISAILTNQRLMFFDYEQNDIAEMLRVARGMSYLRKKELIFEIMLSSIKFVTNENYFKIILTDGTIFEFDNEELFELLKNHI